MSSYWPFDFSKAANCRLFLISGAEELLLNQSHQQLITLAKNRGFIDHYRLEGAESLDRAKLDQLILNKGLFSEGTLIDLRLNEGKTGRAGVGVLNETLDKIVQHKHVFLVLTARHTKGKFSAKWVDKFEQQGIHVQHPLLNHQRKQEWLIQRLKQANLSIEQQGQDFLLFLTEGNLPALAQQVQQLELSGLTSMTLQDIRQRCQDASHFNLFALPEKMLSGQSTKALRICRRLRQEGEPLVRIVWSIINELNLAIAMAELRQCGQSTHTFCQQNRIWQERTVTLVKVADMGVQTLRRHAQSLNDIDKQSKGQTPGDGWLSLEQLIAKFSLKLQ